MTAPTSQPARVVSRMGEVGRLRGGDEMEGEVAIFSTEGNNSDTDSAVAEPTAAEVAPHSHEVPAGAGQAGDGTTGEALVGVDRGALDRLLSAAAKAADTLARGPHEGAAYMLRGAITEITGGKGVWRATAGHSHCAVTGTWLEARDEAARLLGAPVASVTLRRLK